MSSPRTKLAMGLLGLEDSDLREPEVPDSEMMKTKRENLRADLADMKAQVTDKRLVEFLIHSGEGAAGQSAPMLHLLEEERAKNAGIVQRDRDRVEAFRQAMRQDIVTLVKEEMRKKELDQARLDQSEKFDEKIQILTESRNRVRVSREEKRAKRMAAKASILAAAEAANARLREEMEEGIRAKLATVDARKAEIRKQKQAEAEAYREKLDSVKARIGEMDAEGEAEAYRMLESMMRKMEIVEEKREAKIRNWVQKSIERREAFHKRIQAKSDLLDAEEDSRGAEADDERKKVKLKAKRRAENRQDIRDLLKERMEKEDAKIASTVERAKGMLASKIRTKTEEYEAKFGAVDRKEVKARLLEEAVGAHSGKRGQLAALVRYNVQRNRRRTAFELGIKIGVIRTTNDRINALRDVEKVRAEKQKLLRRNWIEKSNLVRQLDKMRRSNNDFARIVKELGIDEATVNA